MDFSKNNPVLKPYSRGVSVIGVGGTPFMLLKDDKEVNGLTEGELFGYAAIEAMKDAGVDGSDIDFYVHGQAGPGWISNFGTPNMHVANWFGMKAKGSFSHSQACCTGYIGLELACNMVASGVYDVVLTGCIDMPYSIAYPERVLTKRRYGTDIIFQEVLASIQERDYTLFNRAAITLASEGWLDRYVQENNLSAETVDRMMTTMAIAARRTAALNPRSLSRDTYEDLAHKFKMDTAEQFLHSKFNPKLGKYVRACHYEQRCDGAGAAVVCATDIAHRFTDHPIEVLGVGHSNIEFGTPALEKYATERAYTQVRDLTGLTGADMDLFLTNDFFMQGEVLSSEMCEYLPKNKGWEYMIEGRTTFEGDRPIQTNGGRCQYGHASSASGLHDVLEAVKQMRGLMGPTQVKKPVKHAMLRGFGGGQNVVCAILKNN